jgi:short-subunit dehydrogenase
MADSLVVIVTGASSGIGEATARLFAQKSYRVVLAARRHERLQSLADEIRNTGGQALAVPTDLMNLADIQTMVQTCLDHFGQIDVLFNNAGFGRLDWLERLDVETGIEAQFRVNVLGMVETAWAVLPHMIARRGGHIINMGSVASFIATPTYCIYSASKFAVRGFTEALRREVSVFGVHVSGVYPGGVETEFTAHAGIKRKTGWTTPAALRLSPEQVAQAVFSLTRRPRRAIILPWPMVAGVWLNRFFPGLMDWIIERRFTRPERGF